MNDPAHAMLRAASQAALEAGIRPTLKGVTVQASFVAPLFTVQLEQSYRNDTPSDLEVVYSFPLPPRAVLTALEFQLGDRCLRGSVRAKRAAERDYEKAVQQGDSAVLVEHGTDGVYTASLGNLRAGEHAVIRLQYAQLAPAAGASWRLCIPTVLAPFYGDAEADGGLAPHQVPEHDLHVMYPLTVCVDLQGPYAPTDVHCPSHPVRIEAQPRGLRVTADGALDRDFVLLAARAAAPLARCCATDEGAIAAAAIDVPAHAATAGARSVRLVLDCSSSMAGESIDWALVACESLLRSLREGDEFSITRFGTQHKHWQPSVRPATVENVAAAARWLEQVDADLGGTEIESALRAAAALPGAAAGDLLLVTDGEIWATDALIRWARASGLRVFVVGVGAAPHAAFLQQLAHATGGRCEIVAPGEDVYHAVARLAAALAAPNVAAVSADWPAAPRWTVQIPPRPAVGDTVYLLAGFDAPVQGTLRTRIGTHDAAAAIEVLAEPLPALQRVAALERIHGGHFEDPAAAAERYQLVTEWTSLIAVAVRDAADKADGLPSLHTVPQMLAAGWSGTGRSRLASIFNAPVYAACAHIDFLAMPAGNFSAPAPAASDIAAENIRADCLPALTRLNRRLLRLQVGGQPFALDRDRPLEAGKAAPPRRDRAWPADDAGTALRLDFALLHEIGLPAQLIEALRAQHAERGAPEAALCGALLLRLAQELADSLGAAQARRIEAAMRAALADAALVEAAPAVEAALQRFAAGAFCAEEGRSD